jgi:NADH-quinone oxidoreductase subunit N
MLVGMTGTTSLPAIVASMNAEMVPVTALGAAFMLGGMGFKLGVFPFHMWIPDAYEGAPTPVVTFMSVAPKAAAVAALCQLLFAGLPMMMPAMHVPIVLLAAITIMIGNLMALPQSNVKRLLAYSGVGHIGLVLLAIATANPMGLGILGFYMLAYLVTNTGAFLVIHAVREGGGGRDQIVDFNGLIYRNGWLAMAMLLFLLSLAGIPFVVGFWAKIYVFLVAWMVGLRGLVVLGALMSVVALFYYLRVVRAMFMTEPKDDQRIQVDFATNLGIIICVVAVVGMGLYPAPFLDSALLAAHDFVGVAAAP